MTLIAYGFSVPNYSTVLTATGLMALVFWLTWHVGWRPRQFHIVFSRGFLRVNKQHFDYADIQSYGLSEYGGGIVDPVSIGVPRNITIGPHIYIDIGGKYLPITVGLKKEQAKEALRLFSILFDAHHSS